ncbi:MAG: hypothetical protein HXS41_06470 [Theionarchaea archaeon]|nr:hypothetical protein [Theionarchaea archaeon]MBU6999708.1 hypothetical protein [Theionarchaea archaeon]MBU7020684.1 hypothetical protein [Theionarchaea archaeon]MBU7034650.1 hypothetical protein [Theionarchaea archaeon]MBU7039859.1 hypothetical protein [Theionarchaea archaeon]
MKRTALATLIIVVGLLVAVAGIIPLSRRVIVTEEKIMQVTEYREENRTKEEIYYEETVIGTESREEILLHESIPVTRGSTLGSTFTLTAGDIVTVKAHSEGGNMMLSFTGQGEIYMGLEVGEDIDQEFTIKKDGEHSLLYSSADVTKDIVIDFDVIRKYEESITEEEERTRTVEYTEKVPYLVDVPYTEQTAGKETYTLDYLRYTGIVIVVLGTALYMASRKSKRDTEPGKGARKKK